MGKNATPQDAASDATVRQARSRPHLRIRSIVAIVVLVPTATMAVLAGHGATTSWSERRTANEVQAIVDDLVARTDVRTAVTDEDLLSSVFVLADELGTSIDEVGAFYEIDFRGQLTDARAVVDAFELSGDWPELESAMAELEPLRARIDRTQASFTEVNAAFRVVHGALDAAWLDRAESLTDGDVTVPGTILARRDALARAFAALVAAGDWSRAAAEFHRGFSSPAVVADLVGADLKFSDATGGLPDKLGPAGTEAWERFVTDPTVQRYEVTLRTATLDAAAGATSALGEDVLAFGEAFADGDRWFAAMTDVVRGAAADLRTAAVDRSGAAARSFAATLVVAGQLALLSLGGAAYLAVILTRPVRRLGRAADEVRAGVFDAPALDLRGPRELVETAEAFNDMTATLAAVEARVVALADDPGRDAPVAPLPGRIGVALEAAFDTLLSSVRAVEEQRRQLAQRAAHDGMTGLLNRAAALPAIERSLAQARRTGGAVMLLYVDLDGLKAINDTHGHALGDATIRQAANALASVARQADVVARIGGDEFIVAGPADEGADDLWRAAERFRAAVAASGVRAESGEWIPLRASVGMAVSDDGTESVEELIQRADAAMYDAKRAGRDRVAIGRRTPRADATGSATPVR